MVKAILMVVVMISASEAFAGAKVFRFISRKSVVTTAGGIFRIFHPQAVDNRTGVDYDISAKSDPNALCLNLGFGRRAVDVDIAESYIHRAVVIDRHGDVVARGYAGPVISIIDCYVH